MFPAGEAGTVFVATGTNFPDAIAAGSAAASLGSPVLITRPDALPAAIASELARLAPARVAIVGSPAAVSDAVGSTIQAIVPDYRGPAPWSATETVVLRDFVLSRVIDGKQQIQTHVTLHTIGELILWPFGYTRTDIPADMTVDDHSTFVAMGRAMASLNGYTAQQSSDLYVTDGDQIDWMYATQHIFSFTFELYPSEQVSSHADHEPPDEVIAAQTARNGGALLYLFDMAACPYAAIGKAGQYC